MLDVIHKNVCRKARYSSYQRDIFAVLAVGVGPYFYGFSMEKQLFWPIIHLVLALQNRILK